MFGAVLNRLATSVRRALSKYAVGTQEPELAFDFIDNEYITNNSTSNFASAITHSRSGNAVMTDGYGPELVANGGFDSGTDGWSVAGTSCTLSYDNGKAQTVCTGTDGNSRIGRSVGILTAGTAYIFTLQYYEASSYGFIRVTSGSITGSSIQQEVNTTNNGNRRVTMVFVPSTTQEYFVVAGGNFTAGSVSTFDNVSVREMPVLKWAPHNLLSYSEQFDNAAWTKANSNITSNNAVAPDGTQTADRVNITADSNVYVRRFQQIDAYKQTFGIFAKAGTTSSIQLYVIQQGAAVGTADINLSNGAVSSVSGAWTGGVTATDVGNGWYFIEGTRTFTAAASNHAVGVSATNQNGLNFYLWGAHLYRSDLGGMVDNPDQPPSRASYVPTTSSAVYLPRVGHHVYNGSAWVNEGLLAESEARTNSILYSQDFTNAAWTKTNTATLALDSVGPDGQANSAVNLVDSGASGTGVVLLFDTVTVETSSTYTASVYAKKNGLSDILLYHGNFTTPSDGGYYFNLEDGTITSGGSSGTATIEEVGNGWYRCAITFTTDAADTSGAIRMYVTDGTNITVDLDGTSSVLIYGAQLEKGATPSSLIPTSGSSVTRAAETFTIPSANLPWPSPNYIGSELVTNGTFDTNTTGWTGNFAGVTLSVDNQRLKIAVSGAASGYAFQEVPTVAGKVYSLKVDKTDGTNTAWGVLVESTIWLQGPSSTDADGSYEYYFVASDSSTNLRVYGYGDGTHVFYDNISVREINPLSVSIAMDGRMTYADEDAFGTVTFFRWYDTSSNYILIGNDTDSTDTGEINFRQIASGTQQITNLDAYSPDIFVPFNVAMRNGSTFVGGAVDGVAATANTAVVELPDLSATDLDLAYDYMGTVGTFRVWDKDLGDAGLVEATNPSLEPSLSLTFEGAGTNSFVVNDWSE